MQTKPFTTIDPEHLLLDAIQVLGLAKNNTLGFIKNFLKYAVIQRPPYSNSFLCYNYDLKRFQFYNRTSQDIINIVQPNKYSYTVGTIICVDKLQIYPMKSLIIFPIATDQLIDRHSYFKTHPDEIEDYLNSITHKISDVISTLANEEIAQWKLCYESKPIKGLF